MRRMLRIATLAVCTVVATGLMSTAALAQENEYELNLPGAGGGSVDPSARSNDRPEASEDEDAPVEAPPSVTPAPIDPEVDPVPLGETRKGQRPESERSLAERRYPRGETYALGPAEQASAVPTAIPTDDGNGTTVLAVIAAAAGLLILAAAWRLWTRDAEEDG